MRVLLLHPEDPLLGGPWSAEHWDRIVDLGRSGEAAYARACADFGCPVDSLDSFRLDFQEMRRVRELLALGLGRLSDQYGLDWWELTSILIHHQLELAILLQELARTLSANDEIRVSRPGFHAGALKLAVGTGVGTFPLPAQHEKRGVRHYLRLARKFSPSQLAGIFWDKRDPGYQLRGRLSARPRPSSQPVVLLPTAYINASRTGIEYANALPQTQFLLVATRPSGWVARRPRNVSMAWLRSYASVAAPERKREYSDLLARWRALHSDLQKVPEFHILTQLGIFDDFPDRMAHGLEIRDAWRNVFAFEPVQSVLCADDSNPYTHIPLLLARHSRLPTLACHHGALDGRYMFKRPHADRILAKGAMEQDYLLRLCRIPPEQVEVGAAAPPGDLAAASLPPAGNKPWIVLFSEAYEVPGGRAVDFYEDLLPPLAEMALGTGRELVVKLHPSESRAEREGLIARVLRPGQERVVRVLDGGLTPEFFAKIWFGITILSTVTLECALRGIPCFLCKWLEAWPYGYVDQYARFGAGVVLSRPSQIGEIPRMLESYRTSPTLREDCWSPIAPARLRTLLGFSPTPLAQLPQRHEIGTAAASKLP